jgi:site-specific recombinase XerC
MPKYPAESYTKAECRAILDANENDWFGSRNRALIVVLWRAGLRLAEALALRPQDVDMDAMTIRVLHGKGDRARTVGFDPGTKGELQAWLDVRGHLPMEDAPLFCTRIGERIQQSYVRTILPRLAKKAGVLKRVHAHGFRHTFAVELAREGVSMINIQRLLGHASLATTSIYLASLSPEEALDAVRGRKW